MEELRTQAEERLKKEEMRTQLEVAKIQAQASQQSEHNVTSGGIRSVREWESSKFKMPKLPSFVDRKDDLDSWLLRYERQADLEEVARSAELFLTARKRQLSDRGRQVLLIGKTSLPFSRRINSYVTFVEGLATLPRIVGIKRLKGEVVITMDS
ncbi:hypothetical protein RRG08_064115 [Elysia crispata]|uniref:Uncharacterized protein n=1 Tax=Elysia crispata TaxID=231223 RepID=A0AAE1B8F5_9GAST|nr:hypothetical protein RRG08_064115 [Elysia crispata]